MKAHATLPTIDATADGLLRRRRPIEPPTKDFVTLAEAADYLNISLRALERHVREKRFGHEDGCRKFGGLRRVYFSQMKRRAIAGTLMRQDESALSE